MDSVFEKITLYDILGYFMPGSLVVIAVCGKVIQGYNAQAVSLYDEFSGLLTYGFILLSLICGLLISEVSRKFLEWREEEQSEEEQEKKIEFPVPEETIKRALKKADIIKKGDNVDVKKYIGQMYGDIQSDKEYKRVHNYASAEVMCKNLAFAVPISALIVSSYFYNDFNSICKYIGVMVGIVACGVLCGVAFFKRYERFCKKKQNYAIIWYVEKYLGKNKVEDEE